MTAPTPSAGLDSSLRLRCLGLAVWKGFHALWVGVLVAGCAPGLGSVQRRAASCNAQEMQAGLTDSRSWVRIESCRGLGQCRVSAARDALEQRATDAEEVRWVRAAAARALGRLSPAASSVAVLSGLVVEEREEAEVRVAALDGLSALESLAPAACDVLSAAIETEDILVAARARVVQANARCGAPTRGGEGAR